MKYFSIILSFALLIVLTAISTAQTQWTKYSVNPVMGPGPTGSWDDQNVGMPCVILVADTFHMWYDGNWDDAGIVGNGGIGHATSVDGVTWEKDTLNPVLLPTAGSWDSELVSQATVIFDSTNALFHMWYAGAGPNPSDPTYIGHATSTDGGNWIKDDTHNPVLSPGSSGEWDDWGPYASCVILIDTTYYMWYDALEINTNYWSIGCATSADGILWTKYDDPTTTNPPYAESDPVLNRGISTEWDYPDVRAENVIFDGIKFHMFYTGGSWLPYEIGYAYSLNGINWTKDTLNNPVLQKGPASSWDDHAVFNSSVLLSSNNDSLKMWYAGVASNGLMTSKIGYATAPADCVVSIRLLNKNLPNGYVLHQNYPNPFNPTTNIEFSIPKSEFVTLKVFNVLGEEVATLVSERLTSGTYKYDWDASSLASGVYLYRIQAGAFQQIKKMILIK